MHAHAILRDMLSNPLDIGATHLLQYGGVRPSQSKSFNGQAKGHGTVKDPVKDRPGGKKNHGRSCVRVGCRERSSGHGRGEAKGKRSQ